MTRDRQPTPPRTAPRPAFLPALALAAALAAAGRADDAPAPAPGGPPGAVAQADVMAAYRAAAREDFAGARAQFLALAGKAQGSQAQVFRVQAAFCSLLAGEEAKALGEFRETADAYSDVFYHEPMGVLNRLDGFDALDPTAKRQVLNGERMRMGLPIAPTGPVPATAVSTPPPTAPGGAGAPPANRAADPAGWLKRLFTRAPAAKAPSVRRIWQDWAMEATQHALRGADQHLAETLAAAAAALPPDETRRLLLEVANQSCVRMTPEPEANVKALDRVEALLAAHWPADGGGSKALEARYAYTLGKVAQMRAFFRPAPSARPAAAGKAEAAAKADKGGPRAEDLKAAESFLRKAGDHPGADAAVRLGAAYRLLGARRAARTAARDLDGMLADAEDFVARFPKSRLAPMAMLDTVTLLNNWLQTDRAVALADRLTASYPDAPEAKSAAGVKQRLAAQRPPGWKPGRVAALVAGNAVPLLAAVGFILWRVRYRGRAGHARVGTGPSEAEGLGGAVAVGGGERPIGSGPDPE